MRFSVLLASFVSLTGCAVEPGTDPVIEPATPGGKGDGPWADGIPSGWDAIAARCAPPGATEVSLYANDFHWWYTREELATRFAEIYESGKRLSDRAFFEPATESFIMPHVPAWGGRVVLSRRLIENVSRHITKALELRYAEQVFFPDMGHSHFFVPTAHWDATYAGTPVPRMSDMYSRLLDDPELLILYHTAEQLQTHDEATNELLPDPELAWRYNNRNPLGDNKGLGRLEMPTNLGDAGNTVREYDGHRFFSAGFNVSASKDGCFPYLKDGEVFYFDLSLSDLPYANPS